METQSAHVVLASHTVGTSVPGLILSSLAALILLLLCASADAQGTDSSSVQVDVVQRFYNPNQPELFVHLIDLMRNDPQVKVNMWSGFSLPGGGGRAAIIMAIAGDTAPDIIDPYFHLIRSDIDQGFLYPLNEWIGDDQDGDGFISDDEAVWPGWRDVPELWKRVATKDGRVYGIPQVERSMMGVIFRTDLVRAAGLDPNKPPRTWDEFYDWCMRLSDPGRALPGRSYTPGQKGVGLVPMGFTWLPWMQSAGGNPIVQIRVDPRTGKEYRFPLEAVDFHLPDGKDLSGEPAVFRADFDSKEGREAAAFFHRLRWAPWIVDPESGAPVSLSEESAAAGRVEFRGKMVAFSPDQVIRGVSRSQSGARDDGPLTLLGRGEIAMTSWFVSDLMNVGLSAGVNPDLLSWFPFPARTAEHPRVVQVQCHYASMATNVRNRAKEDRDKAWNVLQAITDTRAKDESIRRMINMGLSRFVNPRELERLGYTDFLRDVPSSIREIYAEIDTGTIRAFTEPYQGFWMTMDGALNREVISLILSAGGKDFDYVAALQKVTRDANSGVMFSRTPEELARYRLPARLVFGIGGGVLALVIGLTIKSLIRKRNESVQGMVRNPLLPWMLLFPALFLIALWGYYPLFQGMVMAFNDFRISGETRFVGLDNFIALALDGGFWMSMARTLYYVAITMAVSFTAPIVLAIMLSEVPRGKVLYRTLFFLPQVTSGLVIALIWKMMYDPNPTGLMNRMIAVLDKLPFIDIGPQSWLQDPALAMLCVVLPGAWAGMGINSLLYLAALKSVPEDAYEACEIDSGGIWAKLRHITFPVLSPLILINFVGTFIATFQNMGNIFLLTFGGPGESTMVVGMRIWIEAYNNLRFSTATSMAWILGSCLIGFTYLQIQMLKRVEFRKTAE